MALIVFQKIDQRVSTLDFFEKKIILSNFMGRIYIGNVILRALIFQYFNNYLYFKSYKYFNKNK